jgi:DNA-binding transcriptional regulator YiaG
MTTTITDLTPHSTQILKTDKRGHIQFPKQLREDLLDRFESSGMSGAEFAKFYHISYSTFATWRKKRSLQRNVPVQKNATRGQPGLVVTRTFYLFQ